MNPKAVLEFAAANNAKIVDIGFTAPAALGPAFKQA
jgi:hypothetical protein